MTLRSQKQSISGHSRPRECNGPRREHGLLRAKWTEQSPAEMRDGERGRRSGEETWGQTICNLERNGKKSVRSMGNMVPTGS